MVVCPGALSAQICTCTVIPLHLFSIFLLRPVPPGSCPIAISLSCHVRPSHVANEKLPARAGIEAAGQVQVPGSQTEHQAISSASRGQVAERHEVPPVSPASGSKPLLAHMSAALGTKCATGNL